MTLLATTMPKRSRPSDSQPHSIAASGVNSRIEVCPPQLWPSSLSWSGRLQRWLARGKPWASAPSRPLNRLAPVKADFQLSLDGLEGGPAEQLADQIERARSLRELWHLRSPLYTLLALHFDQREAERRMAGLNHYFPMRTARRDAAVLQA